MPRPSRVSPTAFATGMVWERAGLSPPGWVPEDGRTVDRLFQAMTRSVARTTGFSFNSWLLARHRAIDAVLEQAIADGHVHTVIELAAGFSGRGLRLCQRYPELRYLETDLPHMVRLKRAHATGRTTLPAGLGAQVIDVSRSSGDGSLAELLARLPADQGVAVVTEGLMNYLPGKLADGLWRQIANGLQRFAQGGLYVADCYLPAQAHPAMAVLGLALMGFTRGRLHSHLWHRRQATARLQRAGFETIAFTPCTTHAPGPSRVDQRSARAVSCLTATVATGNRGPDV
jgi:O-methyltransferase involved in polyketide biosynthesis